MSKSVTKDMTVGSPMRLIVSFFIPLLLGMLFQQFYSMMDTIIVGRCLGVNALAAVGSTGSVNFMIIGFCMGVCNGFCNPGGTAFWSKRPDRSSQIRGKQRMAFNCFCSDHDHCNLYLMQTDHDMDAYSGRYF